MVQHLPAALPAASALPETGSVALMVADRVGPALPVADRSGFTLAVAEWPGFALRAPHFLLLRQKKVSKEKATPGYAVGCADFPALLEAGGGCGTRPYGPQTVLALFPRTPALLGVFHGGS